MGALIGLVAGAGILLVLWTFAEPDWQPTRRTSARRHPVADLLAAAGVVGVSPGQLVATCVVAFVVGAVVMTGVSGVVAIGVVFGAMAGALPVGVLRGRAIRRLRDHAALWPDAVDNLASAVRAGLSLPEALIQLGERGPEAMRDAFVQFGRDYHGTGRFNDSLDRLKDRLADPVGDRVIEALRIARDVGGGDLGRMLRSLSGFLREDLRTRGELESRQSWTVNGARLAVAAPWLVLLLMCLQGDVVGRFASGAGLVVLTTGAVLCVVAYRLMMWIGRLPTERRILA
ncbi:type II secretion system protein F [Aeromicrobium sp. SMF47]|uniref:Type II secretion system protein F n=1 Tax=Aeromicrobium yanjiei TaxID=2662028 RepID=A0A5Q2MHM1_9ACTN|nr:MULTISPECIES: type II secretion system F family protein [Aeromicrobium]MRJ76692.1 type II secretion system protein F [Aeromicrobium yanjiei]MRK01037.1 type II secretion system protein F [Aeromicrobium sp. S22]QGG42158.1 type II secretion system protein F [Aeromicrobium yanjiei]